MVVDNIENDIHIGGVGGVDKVTQLLARAEVGVHVEEVLDAVAVVGGEVGALFPDGTDPEGGDAEAFQVAELVGDAADGAALPGASGAHPGCLIGGGELAPVAAIKEGHSGAVGEAVGQQEVEDLVAPVTRAFVHAATRGEAGIGQASGGGGFDLCHDGLLLPAANGIYLTTAIGEAYQSQTANTIKQRLRAGDGF